MVVDILKKVFGPMGLIKVNLGWLHPKTWVGPKTRREQKKMGGVRIKWLLIHFEGRVKREKWGPEALILGKCECRNENLLGLSSYTFKHFFCTFKIFLNSQKILWPLTKSTDITPLKLFPDVDFRKSKYMILGSQNISPKVDFW